MNEKGSHLVLGPCYFAANGATGICEGPIQRAHFIAQQTLKREHALANPRTPPAWFIPTPLTGTKLSELLADRRNWRWACHRHHYRVDGFWDGYDPPESARQFAAELGLDHYLAAREKAA